MPAEVGQPAPDFSLYDTDRNVRTLQEFRGKTVVLAFFPGAFTGVCTTEACALRDSLSDFEGMNAQVLGVSVDGPFAQKAWADANSVNYPFLSDFNRQAANDLRRGPARPGRNGRLHRLQPRRCRRRRPGHRPVPLGRPRSGQRTGLRRG